MNKLAKVLLLSLSSSLPLSWANSAAGLNSDLGSDISSDTSVGETGEITLSSKQVAALRACFDGFSSEPEQAQAQTKVLTKAACYEQTLLPLLAASGSHSAKESNQLTAQVQPNVNTPQLPAATSKRLIKEQVQEPEAQMGQKYLRDITKQVNQRIAVNLTKAKKDVHQRWMYYFDNGQVWQQQEARYMSRIKQFPVSAVIEEGILGSHNLTFDGSSKVFKVRRIQ